ncbi:MAG: hypothetical protein HQM01_07070, partial [Magnetococcales bacterium]|nr:hypothetical protein [Magnetococcales bacterium]
MAEATENQNPAPVVDEEEESRQTLDDLTVLQQTRTVDMSAESSSFTDQGNSNEDLQALGSIQMGSGMDIQGGMSETQETESIVAEEDKPVDGDVTPPPSGAEKAAAHDPTVEVAQQPSAEEPAQPAPVAEEANVAPEEPVIDTTSPTTPTSPTAPTTATTPTSPTAPEQAAQPAAPAIPPAPTLAQMQATAGATTPTTPTTVTSPTTPTTVTSPTTPTTVTSPTTPTTVTSPT